MREQPEIEATSQNTPSQPRHERDVRRFERETDVLVVGLGVAGACASLEALSLIHI